MRPEFIQIYKKQLCCDAFSGFDRDETNRIELRKATKFLHDILIPSFTEKYSKLTSAELKKFAFSFSKKKNPKIKLYFYLAKNQNNPKNSQTSKKNQKKIKKISKKYQKNIKKISKYIKKNIKKILKKMVKFSINSRNP